MISLNIADIPYDMKKLILTEIIYSDIKLDDKINSVYAFTHSCKSNYSFNEPELLKHLNPDKCNFDNIFNNCDHININLVKMILYYTKLKNIQFGSNKIDKYNNLLNSKYRYIFNNFSVLYHCFCYTIKGYSFLKRSILISEKKQSFAILRFTDFDYYYDYTNIKITQDHLDDVEYNLNNNITQMLSKLNYDDLLDDIMKNKNEIFNYNYDIGILNHFLPKDKKFYKINLTDFTEIKTNEEILQILKNIKKSEYRNNLEIILNEINFNKLPDNVIFNFIVTNQLHRLLEIYQDIDINHLYNKLCDVLFDNIFFEKNDSIDLITIFLQDNIDTLQYYSLTSKNNEGLYFIKDILDSFEFENKIICELIKDNVNINILKNIGINNPENYLKIAANDLESAIMLTQN